MKSLRPGVCVPNVPLFPLPHVALFPGAVLPLHVFEPRYRAMADDAINGNKLICMANIEDSQRVNALGQPEILTIAGVGEVVDHEQLPDGRFHLLLLGRARVTIEELKFTPPYRRGALTVLAPDGEDPSASDRAALRVAIQRQTARVRASHPEFEFDYPATLPTPALIDLCSHYLVTDARARQQLLETLNVGLRLQRCLEALMDQAPVPRADMN